MKAHKLTVLVIDFDQRGPDEVASVITNARYPNRCISPDVMGIETADIGEWDDDHPLNMRSSMKDAFSKTFPSVNGELLEALESCLPALIRETAAGSHLSAEIAQARAAIAKAKGE